MAAWTCPRCDRQFGRANRPHVCEPGMPVDLWLDNLPEPQRRAAEKVLAIVRRFSDLIIEAVTVGILVKRDRTIIELRPKHRWLQLTFISTATITSPKISRSLPLGSATLYYLRLADGPAVDADVRRWISAALQ